MCVYTRENRLLCRAEARTFHSVHTLCCMCVLLHTHGSPDACVWCDSVQRVVVACCKDAISHLHDTPMHVALAKACLLVCIQARAHTHTHTHNIPAYTHMASSCMCACNNDEWLHEANLTSPRYVARHAPEQVKYKKRKIQHHLLVASSARCRAWSRSRASRRLHGAPQNDSRNLQLLNGKERKTCSMARNPA